MGYAVSPAWLQTPQLPTHANVTHYTPNATSLSTVSKAFFLKVNKAASQVKGKHNSLPYQQAVNQAASPVHPQVLAGLPCLASEKFSEACFQFTMCHLQGMSA